MLVAETEKLPDSLHGVLIMYTVLITEQENNLL